MKEQHEVKLGLKQSICEKDLRKAQAMLRVSQTTKAEAIKYFSINRFRLNNALTKAIDLPYQVNLLSQDYLRFLLTSLKIVSNLDKVASERLLTKSLLLANSFAGK